MCVYTHILLEVSFPIKIFLRFKKKLGQNEPIIHCPLRILHNCALIMKNKGGETVWQALLLKKQTITEDEDAPLLSNTAKR